ncbi:hypothetical protein GOODEAATRI_024930 [Goodea atripinnis]|uniref:Uncharacterized protein n=1 Tax=Goodea atripinnis TaxID=208336 RepID=A0ABV0PGX5_9TELE
MHQEEPRTHCTSEGSKSGSKNFILIPNGSQGAIVYPAHVCASPSGYASPLRFGIESQESRVTFQFLRNYSNLKISTPGFHTQSADQKKKPLNANEEESAGSVRATMDIVRWRSKMWLKEMTSHLSATLAIRLYHAKVGERPT